LPQRGGGKKQRTESEGGKSLGERLESGIENGKGDVPPGGVVFVMPPERKQKT